MSSSDQLKFPVFSGSATDSGPDFSNWLYKVMAGLEAYELDEDFEKYKKDQTSVANDVLKSKTLAAKADRDRQMREVKLKAEKLERDAR